MYVLCLPSICLSHSGNFITSLAANGYRTVCTTTQGLAQTIWYPVSLCSVFLSKTYCEWICRLQVFMVARDNGTTYNGLAKACNPTSRLPALASGCPTTAFADCNQVLCSSRLSSNLSCVQCMCLQSDVVLAVAVLAVAVAV